MCNCSICSRNGYLHVYLDRSEIVYLKGEDTSKGYYFSEKKAEHKFCPNCGSSFSVDPHGSFGSPDWVSINVGYNSPLVQPPGLLVSDIN